MNTAATQVGTATQARVLEACGTDKGKEITKLVISSCYGYAHEYCSLLGHDAFISDVSPTFRRGLCSFTFMVPCITDLIFVSFQRDPAVSSLYFISLQDLSTCFGCSLHPSSGVLKTSCTTTGTSHVMWQVSSVMG
jgi:hypothetical protein